MQELENIKLPKEVIPEEYRNREDVSVILVFITGTKKQRAEKFAKIKRFCRVLQQIIF